MQRFYFDHNAASPLAPEVLQEFTRALADVPGNASSIHHSGQSARQQLEAARRNLAALFGCDARELVFTSGGTESDNLAIVGFVSHFLAANPGRRAHLITTAIEHPAVLNTCESLAKRGIDVTFLPPDSACLIDPGDLRRAIRPETVLISMMHANNETGTIEPIEDCAAIAREAGIAFHTDAVQTAGRLPLNVRSLGADLLSIGGHKFGAPKGVGALYIRKGVNIEPLLYGGHHERDRRAGTENVAGAVALSAAATYSLSAQAATRAAVVSGSSTNGFVWQNLSALRDRLEQGILHRIPGAFVNGSRTNRLPNTTNIRFCGIEGEATVIALDLRGFAVSSGSACSSGAVEPSHVLVAMGLSPEEARSGVRFSLGPGNTADQVDALIEAVALSVAHLRRISPQVLAHA